MPRDAFGIYTLPSPQNPVVSGQTISAADFNTTMDDVATALTESLNVDGTTPYDAPLQMVNGTEAAPGYTFAADVQAGMFRSASNGIGISWGGTERFRANGTYAGFNAIDVKFVPGATWPATGGQIGPQVASTIGGTGTDAYLFLRRLVVTSAMSPYTYTPTTGARLIRAQLVGGGGGGGGLPITATTDQAVSAGGGGGGYAAVNLSGSQIEATYTIAIGAAGANGAAAGAGGAGGNTTLTGGTSSTLYARANGGAGGTVGSKKATTSGVDPATTVAAAAGGTADVGTELYSGSPSAPAVMFGVNTGIGVYTLSCGGCSLLFPMRAPPTVAAWLPGQGSGGALLYETLAAGGTAGVGAGGAGLCIIEEYL
jgi:hypothetical protein